MRKHLLEKLVKLHHSPRPPPKVITWADTTPVGKTTITAHAVKAFFDLTRTGRTRSDRPNPSNKPWPAAKWQMVNGSWEMLLAP